MGEQSSRSPPSTFRVLDTTDLTDDTVLAKSLPLNGELGHDIPLGQRPVAMARELALQAAGVFVMERLRCVALPVGVESLRLHDEPILGEAVQTMARFIGQDDGIFRFDAWLMRSDGTLLEEMRGLTFRHLADLK